MKKVILFFCCLVLSTILSAQSDVWWGDHYGSVVLKGGYNILEKQPVGVLGIYGDIAYLRFGVELSYTQFKNASIPILPFSPMIGATYGERHIFYFLLGGQPWGAVSLVGEKKRKFAVDTWHLKLETGVDFRLSDLLFLNVSAMYLVPYRNTETIQHFQNLSVMIGLGLNL
ncbi:MAG: hypothetical protein IJ870_04940 [Alphaproteobacteria bacterium]|nr:hypothetical protein [Alphaproteobacteria bacterium]